MLSVTQQIPSHNNKRPLSPSGVQGKLEHTESGTSGERGLKSVSDRQARNHEEEDDDEGDDQGSCTVHVDCVDAAKAFKQEINASQKKRLPCRFVPYLHAPMHKRGFRRTTILYH